MIKLDILAIGAHPDDVELSCSGTLLKEIANGKKVGLLDLTKGELGTRGNAQLRSGEAMFSAKKMGAIVREQLDLEDGFFGHSEAELLAIIRVIRRYQPTIVLANALDDRHPDHGRAAKLTADACFLAGLRRIETFENDGTTQTHWRPAQVFHYVQDRSLKADFLIDISPYMEQKIDLVLTFSSQFYDPKSAEPMTPISSPEFLNALRGKDSVYGRLIGVPYAEAFNAARTIGVNSLFDVL